MGLRTQPHPIRRRGLEARARAARGSAVQRRRRLDFQAPGQQRRRRSPRRGRARLGDRLGRALHPSRGPTAAAGTAAGLGPPHLPNDRRPARERGRWPRSRRWRPRRRGRPDSGTLRGASAHEHLLERRLALPGDWRVEQVRKVVLPRRRSGAAEAAQGMAARRAPRRPPRRRAGRCAGSARARGRHPAVRKQGRVFVVGRALRKVAASLVLAAVVGGLAAGPSQHHVDRVLSQVQAVGSRAGKSARVHALSSAPGRRRGGEEGVCAAVCPPVSGVKGGGRIRLPARRAAALRLPAVP